MTNVSFSSLNTQAKLLPLHRVLICGTRVLPQLCQFWETFWTKLTDESSYKTSIGSMRLRLSELQELDDKARNIRVKGLKDAYEEVDRVLHYQRLLFILEAIQTKLISRHHNDPLARDFDIDKTRELIDRKYYWPSLRKDVEVYIKGCNVCLESKAVRHKPYGDLQSLPVPIHWWKDFSIDFVTGLSISINWKGESYDSILVIVNRLTKMVYYEPVKVTINTPRPAEVIIDVVVQYYGLPNSIVTNWGSLFTLKF